MTLQQDLDAAQAKRAADVAEEAEASSAADADLARAAAARVAIVEDDKLIADIKAQMSAQNHTWLSLWCHSSDYLVWKQDRVFAPFVKGYRWRGDGKGRFDFAFSKLDVLAELAAGGFYVSGNFNLRLGMSPNKTAVSLVDTANGRYDKSDIIPAAKALAPFRKGDLEILSEINVMKGAIASQPTFPDWSLVNAEAAFTHVADLMRSNGVTIPIGTSIAGPAQMAKWKSWVTPGMIAKSDFIGFDFYKKKGTPASANLPSVAMPVAFKAAKEMVLPLIVCETGVDKTLNIADKFFTELMAQVVGAAPGSLLGVNCNDGDKIDGAYIIGVGSPNHAAFVTFANDPYWKTS